MTTIYANDALELRSDAFVEGDRKASAPDGHTLVSAGGESIDTTVAGGFPQLSSECPMLDSMYGIAVRDHERLVIDERMYLYMMCQRYIRDFKIPEGFLPEGSVFWAGYGFNTYLYTRDTAYSSWLGTAYILPEVVKSHLQYLRGMRRKLGLKVSKSHAIPIDGVPYEQLELNEREVSLNYNTNSYTRRTDDIVWVLGLWEVYKSTRDTGLPAYILEQFDYFDEHFYRYFLDETDGLYRGQSTFIDVGGACYGGRNASRTVALKALSTNCLYVGAFEMLGKAATLLGKTERAETFAARRDELAESIRTHFGANDWNHYLDEEGKPSGRQETLGLAFLTLYDILPREAGAKLLSDYQGGDYGRPLLWPFCGSDRVYHDNSTWPFADTIFALAEYKVGNRSEVIRATLGKLCRASLDGNFNEVIEYATGRMIGCPGYIWSAASYLAVIYRMIAGMEVDSSGKVAFAPVLPAELGCRLDLEGLKIGEMTVNLHLRGNGSAVESCTIDGEAADSPELDVSALTREVEIHLAD